LSFLNHRYFKKPLNIYCQFIPEVIFLLSIFGYLVVLIFFKWLNFTANEASCAPSLLIDFINMFLMKYGGECSTAMFFTGQETLQKFLVVIALVCVPWMLCVKPLILRRQHQQKSLGINGTAGRSDGHVTHHGEDDEEALTPDGNKPPPASAAGEDEEEEAFDFGDIFIHQAIHTIEYCLGCVSNTASYLRLWALSLAHAQLSEVLWEMVMRNALGIKTWIGALVMVFIFAAWAVLTVAILLLMEGLSAFLHTLRLHWVEFQNKFYTGAGYLFEPFSFKAIMDLSGLDD